MSVHVLMSLLNELEKREKMRGLLSHGALLYSKVPIPSRSLSKFEQIHSAQILRGCG